MILDLLYSEIIALCFLVLYPILWLNRISILSSLRRLLKKYEKVEYYASFASLFKLKIDKKYIQFSLLFLIVLIAITYKTIGFHINPIHGISDVIKPILLQPIGDEILFRVLFIGIPSFLLINVWTIMKADYKKTTYIIPIFIIAQAYFFAFIHHQINPVMTAILFIAGLGYGWLYWRSGFNMLPSLTAHILNNLISSVLG
jgi:membrane protease YdiL (CAAX protease family)